MKHLRQEMPFLERFYSGANAWRQEDRLASAALLTVSGELKREQLPRDESRYDKERKEVKKSLLRSSLRPLGRLSKGRS